jgi:hypothetical protein
MFRGQDRKFLQSRKVKANCMDVADNGGHWGCDFLASTLDAAPSEAASSPVLESAGSV